MNKKQDFKYIIMNKIVEFTVKANAEKLENSNENHRLNSVLYEQFLTSKLSDFINEDKFFKKNKLSIEVPNTNKNCWYDFAIVSKGIFIPVNIKYCLGNEKTNVGTKMGIYYSLTGDLKSIKQNLINNWSIYLKSLKQNLSYENKSDYFFLFCSKVNSKDVFWTSIRKLHHLVPSGDNPPFQIIPEKNKFLFNKRSTEEQFNFIIKTLKKSLELRNKPFLEFKKQFEC